MTGEPVTVAGLPEALLCHGPVLLGFVQVKGLFREKAEGAPQQLLQGREGFLDFPVGQLDAGPDRQRYRLFLAIVTDRDTQWVHHCLY